MAVRLPIYPMKRLICLLLSWMAISHALAQKTLSETDIVDLVLANSPAIRAADLSIRQSDQLLKGAYSIPNLDVFTDSPSGEFYTIGVNQSFQLPTVYKRQYDLQKGQNRGWLRPKNELLKPTSGSGYETSTWLCNTPKPFGNSISCRTVYIINFA